MFSLLKLKEKSGKRDSDPRPQPWQGCALPTELFPQGKINGEEEETRTPTTQLSLPPQSSASTNSATWARRTETNSCFGCIQNV